MQVNGLRVSELVVAVQGFQDSDRFREPVRLARKAVAEERKAHPTVKIQRVFFEGSGAQIFKDELESTIVKRISSWTTRPPTAQALRGISWDRLKARLLSAPPAWQMSVVRTLVGGWTTERRMSHTDCRCVFGCTAVNALDSQAHCMSCECMWRAVHSAWFPDRPMPFFLDQRLGLARSLTDEQRDLACQRVIFAYYMYNARRHESHMPLDCSARSARAQFLQQAEVGGD